MKTIIKSVLAISFVVSVTAHAFELTSNDIQEGHPMAKTFEYRYYECETGLYSISPYVC